MADQYQQYDQALADEAAAVAAALSFREIGQRPSAWLNPQPEREEAERWSLASAAAGVLRSIEETHGGAFANSGRDTNQHLLSNLGVTGSASLRQWSEGKFAQGAADRAAQKEALAADPLRGGTISPRPGGQQFPGWRVPGRPGGGGASSEDGGAATSTEPSALGWLAALVGTAYLAWRFLR